jgi:hypothetical protein
MGGRSKLRAMSSWAFAAAFKPLSRLRQLAANRARRNFMAMVEAEKQKLQLIHREEGWRVRGRGAGGGRFRLGRFKDLAGGEGKTTGFTLEMVQPLYKEVLEKSSRRWGQRFF